MSALDAATGVRMTRERSADRSHEMAHALVDLVTGVQGEQGVGAGPAVSVIIDLDTLCAGEHEHTICEHPDGSWAPVESVRSSIDEAILIPIVVRNGTVPLAVGRSFRLATAGQRRAIEAIHATCAIPECEVAITRCEVHHIVEWEHGGRTDLNNLIPLCSHHHHRVHADGWQLSLDTDRMLTVIHSDGGRVRGQPDRLPRAG